MNSNAQYRRAIDMAELEHGDFMQQPPSYRRLYFKQLRDDMIEEFNRLQTCGLEEFLK